MSRKNVRGLFGLAAILLVASPALAQDGYYTASTAAFGGVDISSRPGDSLSDAGIDRLLQFNASEDSQLRQSSTSSANDVDAVASQSNALAPLSDIAARGPSSGMLVLAGLGAAFTLGVGLCCAGMMTGRQRTINTFSTGLVRMK